MNELVISTFIKIMQDGLVMHDKQESAASFIFDSITMQENTLVTTDINSKKVSRLVSRTDPTPDDIKQAALKSDVAQNVAKYFKEKVVPDLNPYTKYDTMQKIMNVIIQDVSISSKQKETFKKLFDADEVSEFLTAVFLYSLQRNNKKVSDTVEPNDAPLLAEVNYKCPLTQESLVEYIKGIPTKRYEITQIFPECLSPDDEIKFSKIQKKPVNFNDPDNLIALSVVVSENYLLKPTVEEFKDLLEIKKKTSKRAKALFAINRIDLEKDIRRALEALVSLTSSSDLPQLAYDALKIEEKIPDFILRNDVEMLVLQYYRYIESVFSDTTDDFDLIAGEVELCSQKLETAGLSQEEVIKNLSEWIYSKAFINGENGMLACRIVVCFFIQNCEVFKKWDTPVK